MIVIRSKDPVNQGRVHIRYPGVLVEREVHLETTWEELTPEIRRLLTTTYWQGTSHRE
jgi:hypothetical protein